MKVCVSIDNEILSINVVNLGCDGFELFKDALRLGVIFPVIDEYIGYTWKSLDFISPSIINQVGDILESAYE